MEMQDCENVVHLYAGREQIILNELEIDFLFEYCPYVLKTIILNRRISFRLNEIKSFLRQMLLGLRAIHSKGVRCDAFITTNLIPFMQLINHTYLLCFPLCVCCRR